MTKEAVTSVLRSGPAMVVSTLLALAAVATVGWKARDLVQPAYASEASDHAELLERIDRLNTRLDQFNTRLSWLEGATSGAVRPPAVNAASPAPR